MVLQGENMVLTHEILKAQLKDYSNINNKINRKIKAQELFPIITGLYETDPNVPGYLLASSIYGPSYISFEYALAYYGLIPEKVTTVTCATFNKRKKKEYLTKFGNFTYRDVPVLAYPEEILLISEKDYSYQIATPEKALCDKLYTLKPLYNYTKLKNMLFEDLRIDYEDLVKLDVNKIGKLVKLYHCTNIDLLYKYLMMCANE